MLITRLLHFNELKKISGDKFSARSVLATYRRKLMSTVGFEAEIQLYMDLAFPRTFRVFYLKVPLVSLRDRRVLKAEYYNSVTRDCIEIVKFVKMMYQKCFCNTRR